MICATCKTAGRMLALGSTREVADAYHAQCPAIPPGHPTQCDCQHDTSQTYITREVKNERPRSA